jgi:phosphohistidine phosphatase SixA
MLPAAAARGVPVGLALSSPYLRAVQTRDLFVPAFAPALSETSPNLTPDAIPEDALEELAVWEAQGLTRIAVFTHNPLVTLLAGLLLVPGSDPSFHTPTILAIGFDHGLIPRAGQPLWTLNP